MSHSQHVLFKASSAWEVAAPTLPIYSAKKPCLLVQQRMQRRERRRGARKERIYHAKIARRAACSGTGNGNVEANFDLQLCFNQLVVPPPRGHDTKWKRQREERGRRRYAAAAAVQQVAASTPERAGSTELGGGVGGVTWRALARSVGGRKRQLGRASCFCLQDGSHLGCIYNKLENVQIDLLEVYCYKLSELGGD